MAVSALGAFSVQSVVNRILCLVPSVAELEPGAGADFFAGRSR